MTLVLRIPKGDKLTKSEMDNNLTYLEGLSQSKLGTGSFTAFTSSYTTGSFTGSFKGDGSGLTGIPSGTSIATGSFATTGSNVFVGSQIITGSLTVKSGSGVLTSSVRFIHNTISPSQGSSVFEVRHINDVVENFAVKLFADDYIAKLQYEKDGSTFDMLRTNLAGDLHLTQNTRLFETDLRIDGTLKLTGSLSSAASANFLGNVTASLFTGSFVGDGSGLTGVPSSLNTSSFATTGSNTFLGTEVVNGAIIVTGSLNLRSPSYPTSGSLIRIDDSRTHIFVRPSGSNISGNIQLYDSEDSLSRLILNASQISIGVDSTSTGYGNNNAQNFIRGNTQFFQNITSSANIQAISFIGDGSGLTGIPVIGTGSFAITGSNVFVDNQIISGSLLVTNKIESTGSLILKPDVNEARYLEVYNTSPSDTHITASGGQIFIGDDTTYVKVDNYSNFNRIDIVANSGVYVSGLTEITGSLNVIGDQTITGSIYLNTASWNYVKQTFTSIPVTYGQTELTFTVLPNNTFTNISVAVGVGGYTSGSVNLTILGTTFPGGTTPANDIVFNVQTFESAGPVYSTNTTSSISYVSGTPPQRHDNIYSIGTFGIGAGNKHWTLDTSGSFNTPGDIIVSGSLLVSGSANINGFITYPQVSASFNFANDTAASGGGVPLGGLYHTSGSIKIRLA